MNNQKKMMIVSLSIMVLGASFMALGAYRGEAHQVLSNAVIVCLECIGIG